MPRLSSVRRFGLALAGLAGAGAVCIGCSSSTGGTPHVVSSAANNLSVSAPSSAPISLPTTVPGLPSDSISLPGIPTPGSSGSPFCNEFNLADLQKLGSSSDYQSVIATWDKLTKDAPADIKPDFQKVDDYLHSILQGNSNGTTSQDLTTAGEHIGQWFVANCSG